MARKIHSREEIYWVNPLKDVKQKPHLSDEIWVDDPRDPRFTETVERLKLYYCNKREKGNDDLDELAVYLQNPLKNMIVWGEVGIGKSWFLRYELLAGENSISKSSTYHAGIIDILSGQDTEYRIHLQLRHILELYFERFCGGTTNALEDYIKYDLSKFYVQEPDQLTDAKLHDVKLNLQNILKLRNSTLREETIYYTTELLSVLQHIKRDELLVILIDNIDKTRDDEQERLVKLSSRLLRNPQIRLIIPLRKSSRLLLDRFSVLKEFTYTEMELHPVNLREMLRLRFLFSFDRTSLRGNPIIVDPQSNQNYTFPKLFTDLFGENEKTISETGDLLLTLAATNAREALNLTDRLIYSDQLKGLHNIGNPEFGIAALMLSDFSLPKPTTSPVINLFNNEEPELHGNSLIRFRVLEYFWRVKNVSTREIKFTNYLKRLGYDLNRIKDVIELFIMTQMIFSQKGFSTDDTHNLNFEEIGPLQITKSGIEFENIIERMWYWVSVKKDVYLPNSIIGKGRSGREYVTHTDFVEWLRQQENDENIWIKKFTRNFGTAKLDWPLKKPHQIAMKALKIRDNKE